MLGYSQIQVADLTKISESSYKRIEQGSREPSSSELERIAKAFNLSTESLKMIHGPIILSVFDKVVHIHRRVMDCCDDIKETDIEATTDHISIREIVNQIKKNKS